MAICCLIFYLIEFNAYDHDSHFYFQCCPGYVATDLNNNSGNLTVQQGADTPVYLATLKDGDIPKGQFVKERKILNWVESQGDLKVN